METCEKNKGDSVQLIQDYTIKIYNYLSFNVTFNPYIANLSSSSILDGPNIYNQKVTEMLTDMKDQINDMGIYYSNTLKFDCDKTSKWMFISSLLWTITVVTTMGTIRIKIRLN